MFNEAAHPRSGGGTFTEKTFSDASGVKLGQTVPVHEQPVEVGFVFTRYTSDYDDNGIEIKTQTVDVRTILDTMNLDRLPTADSGEYWDSSALEDAAIDAGLIDPDGCSVVADTSYVDVDHPVVRYVESRRDSGLEAPLRDVVPLSPAKQHQKVGEQLSQAHAQLGVVDVMTRLNAGDTASVRADFVEATERIGARLAQGDIDPVNFDEGDRKVLVSLTVAAFTPDSNFTNNALKASAELADWLARRPGTI